MLIETPSTSPHYGPSSFPHPLICQLGEEGEKKSPEIKLLRKYFQLVCLIFLKKAHKITAGYHGFVTDAF